MTVEHPMQIEAASGVCLLGDHRNRIIIVLQQTLDLMHGYVHDGIHDGGERLLFVCPAVIFRRLARLRPIPN
ncbi:hypothetical protein PSTEL_18665 [Paenibacillus stellifer]|uniref:Uncharacterized protein n=1 Tax=Paenibacillus stellifer TaxID=169760 RepID=A0A089N7S8_9BACL|nr:hypothetical protein [Paenibacillus stellifer]AIQ64834.1 hypothetical protein PSTEL_18665 [Paenibacillus stellifer]